MYQQLVKNDHVVDSLIGQNKELDNIRGQIIERKPLSNLQAFFSQSP